MKASFFERLIAYIIDIVIIVLITSLIFIFVPTPDVSGLTKKVSDITETFVKNNDISMYIEKISKIYYEIDHETIILTIIGLMITSVYFVYFQYIYGGRTIGKKLLKIKIVKSNRPLKMSDIALRSFIINGIFCSILMLITMYVIDDSKYFIYKSILELIQFIFILATAFTILFRNDKRGIHDIIFETEVISYRNEEL